MPRQNGRKRFDACALGPKPAIDALIGRSARIGDDMTDPNYAEALRLIRKHMQPGDTLGQMFMRVAKKLEADEQSSEMETLRSALQRIVRNRDNKNWRKPEIIEEAERALIRAKP